MSGSIIVCCGLLGKESRYTVWPDDSRCFSHVAREGVFTDRAAGGGNGLDRGFVVCGCLLGSAKVWVTKLTRYIKDIEC